MAGQPRLQRGLLRERARAARRTVVGEENRGWYVGTTTLDFERSGIQRVIGGMKTCEELIAYAGEQLSDGHGRARGSRRSSTARGAGDRVRGRAAAVVSRRLDAEQGIVPNYEASMSKIYGSELKQRLAGTGMQLLWLGGQLAPGSKWAPLRGRIETLYLTRRR